MGFTKPSPTRLYNWYICMAAAQSMILYGYDASVFNAVQGSDNWMAYVGNPGTQQIGSINTAYTVGAVAAGWFGGGPLADYAGRRVGVAFGCLLVIVSSFMQTFAPSGTGAFACFLAGRCVIGLGQGFALTAGATYINEVAPPSIRGSIMGFWQLFYSVGSFICFWINYACTNYVKSLGDWDWKMVCIFQIMMPAAIIVQMWFIPESPRFYVKRGNIEAARSSLQKIRDTEQEVEDELLTIREAAEFEKEAVSSSYSALWKDKSIRKRLLLAFAINAGQQITGQGSLNSYSTIIYEGVWSDNSTIQLINALNATFGIIFTLTAVFLADRMGRRFLLIVGAAGMALCMLIVSLVGTQTPTAPDGTKSQPVGIAIVFLLFLFILFYKPSFGATVWIWTSEVFSLNVRAQAIGMASQTQNVANIILQQFFPTFLDNCGFATFYFFFAVNIMLAVFVYFFIPETKGKPIEEIDVLFGGANHVDAGGELMQVKDPHHAILTENVDDKPAGDVQAREVKE